jgi:hypothetical protein
VSDGMVLLDFLCGMAAMMVGMAAMIVIATSLLHSSELRIREVGGTVEEARRSKLSDVVNTYKYQSNKIYSRPK